MSKLIQNATRAELDRDCVFAENLESSSAVSANGGTIVGTPVVNFGADLNGTTDRIQYALLGREFNSPEFGAVIDFIPEFDTDADKDYTWFDTSVGSVGRFLLYKTANSGANTLIIYMGGTVVAGVPEAVYSPFWLTNQRNVLVLSGTSGDTNIWLNGNQILTNDPTAWSPSDSSTLYVGSFNSGSFVQAFEGTINSIKIFHSLLTAQEASDYYTNSTYTYMNDAVVNLPMTASAHDPTNVQALDASGNHNNAFLGDGFTPTSYPTKLSKRGYSFDGTTDYLTILDAANLSFTSGGGTDLPFSLTVFAKDIDTTDRLICAKGSGLTSGEYSLFTIGTNIYFRCFSSTNNFIGRIASSVLPTNGISIITATYDASKVDGGLKLYLNGEQVDSGNSGSGTYAGMVASTSTLRLNGQGTYFNNCDLLSFQLHPIELTPTQISDLHHKMLSEVNYNG